MKKRFWIAIPIMAFGLGWPLLAQENPTEPQPQDAQAQAQPAASAPDVKSPGTPQLDAADLEAWLDGYMSGALEQGDVAGAVVSVVKDGRPLFAKGYGYRDVASKLPMDAAQTLVRIGSTSKLFTWTAVMQLVEQGMLDLDADVNTYLDFTIPERDGGPVTMNDLMTHRGGFEEGLKEILITDPAKFITTEKYLKDHMRPRIFPVGKVPAYSNYGTALAGYIVERLSGEPFDDYIERHILGPLHMERSTFRQPLPEKFQDNVSLGYMSASQPPQAFEMITSAPAGSMSATADDMANFMIAHLQQGRFGDARILKAETARLMYQPSAPHEPGFTTMAHGFFSGPINGKRLIGHGGDTIWFHTDMNLIPEEGVGFFVSFNSRGKNEAVYGMRERFVEGFMDRYFPDKGNEPLPPAIQSAKADAQALAGKYRSSRRIDTAFLKLIYTLQQSTVIANEDGTISFASEPGTKYRETAPGMWRDPNSEGALHVSTVDGQLTITNSKNPVSDMQRVPLAESAGLNSFILFGSIAVILLALVAWPLSWWCRRLYGQTLGLTGRDLVAYRLSRLLMVGDMIYLLGWYMALQPLFQMQFDGFGTALDPLLFTLQAGALVPLIGVGAGLWNAWLTVRSDRHVMAKAGSVLFAAALCGVAWVAFIGGLMSFTLEY
ncbi:serine hydrolase domain-containing protein [Kordiimonas aestuarii]|uniref:serine hydrolase domain-containing protein n=1 Tax=Kordiimonas aestuarii TaxID=1005925 RepID=UPI0021D0C852|nr:serine hydrolase domain-containing protein [Kordiimonas aestuarii]